MPRGRAPNYDAQRAAILAQASALFARQGYPSTTMNQVALACGLSKPALYHYFADKDAMLVELTEGHVLALRHLVDEVMAMDVDPRNRLRMLVVRVVQAYADAEHAHRVLTEDTRFLQPEDRERVLSHQRHVVAAFARTMAQYKPELDEAALTKPMTMLVFGMVNWLFTWLRRDGTLDHDAIAPIVADFVMGGLPAVALKHGGVVYDTPAGASDARLVNTPTA
jgi:AcrR family transcriptional regulator